jgi:hypothetical protein
MEKAIRAVDVGFGLTKAIGIVSGRRVKSNVVSVVGHPLSEGTFDVAEPPFQVAVEENGTRGDFVPLGAAALENSEYVPDKRPSDWMLSYDWLALFAGSMLRMQPDKFFHSFNLVTGLPISDYHFKEGLMSRLAGKTFTVKDASANEHVIQIHRTFVMTQPYGSYFRFILNADGTPTEDYKSKWFVCDIGAGTIGFLAVNENMGEIRPLTQSREFGLLRTFKAVANEIYQDLGINPHIYEVSEWLAAGKIPYKNNFIDVNDYFDTYASSLAETVAKQLRSVWPESGRVDRLVVTGGGALALKKYLNPLLADYSNISWGDRFSNVEGYLRFGLSQWAG